MAALIGGAVPALAQDASQAYQVVDSISMELARMNAANDSTPKADAADPPLAERQPRHAIQKAREVWLKVQALRETNGLPTRPVPAFPAHEVTAAGVKRFVAQIHADVVDLRPSFGVTGSAAAPRATGKNATDVYTHLSHVSAQLDTLGIPKISGNEVYQVVLTLVHDLEQLAQARGVPVPAEMATGAEGKKPKDVYAQVFAVADQVKALAAARPEYNVPSGIVALNRRSGRITPAQGKSQAGAGGRQGLEAQGGQDHCCAGIPGIGHDESPRPVVQGLEALEFFHLHFTHAIPPTC